MGELHGVLDLTQLAALQKAPVQTLLGAQMGCVEVGLGLGHGGFAM